MLLKTGKNQHWDWKVNLLEIYRENVCNLDLAILNFVTSCDLVFSVYSKIIRTQAVGNRDPIYFIWHQYNFTRATSL